MIEIKKITKKDIPALFADAAFWNHSFLSISKHRLLAHAKNPLATDDDIILLLAYLNQELVGYMGLFIDLITVQNEQKKIGWLSTWWVHPKTKGTGIGREILNTMYDANNGYIGISQFTPSAKRVYDKSGYFTTLKETPGIKAVLRSNLSFVVPALFPKAKPFTSLLAQADHLLNVVINAKVNVQSYFEAKKLNGISLEYLNQLDEETLELINHYNKQDLSIKGPAFFEWLKAYNWVQKAPLLALTNPDKYAFSIYDTSFDYSLIKVLKHGKCVGFLVLQKRKYVAKVLFAYYDSAYVNDLATIIKLQCGAENTREIICYDAALCVAFKQSSFFLYKTKKVKQSIISKQFGVTDFSQVYMHYGDGDCAFA